MTSNTIANAANIEAARHNLANEELGKDTLAETTRHNQRMEELQNDANAINQEKNQITKTYNSESLRIDYELRIRQQNLDKYLGDQKIKIQQEINDLTAQRNSNDAWYQQRTTELQAQDLDNKKLQNQELARHNSAMETISTYDTTLNNAIREQQLRFDKYKLDIESGLKREELEEVKFRNVTEALKLQNESDFRAQTIELQWGLANNTLQNDYQMRLWFPFNSIWGGGAKILGNLLK